VRGSQLPAQTESWKTTSCRLSMTAYSTEDGGGMFLRNIDTHLRVKKTSQPRRPRSHLSDNLRSQGETRIKSCIYSLGIRMTTWLITRDYIPFQTEESKRVRKDSRRVKQREKRGEGGEKWVTLNFFLGGGGERESFFFKFPRLCQLVLLIKIK
jgi:hypothetical protein